MSVLVDTCRLRIPRGGVSIPSHGEGSGYYSGGSRTSCGGPGLPGGPDPPVVWAERLLVPGTRGAPGANQGMAPGLLLGGQGSGPQGSGCSDVIKDNHKALA